MSVCPRASADLKQHMVVADTMEQFQKDLDQGRVSRESKGGTRAIHAVTHLATNGFD